MLQVDQLQGGGEDSFTANVSKQLSEWAGFLKNSYMQFGIQQKLS